MRLLAEYWIAKTHIYQKKKKDGLATPNRGWLRHVCAQKPFHPEPVGSLEEETTHRPKIVNSSQV